MDTNTPRLLDHTKPPSSDDSKPAGRDAGAPRASESLRFLDTVSLTNTPETADRRVDGPEGGVPSD